MANPEDQHPDADELLPAWDTEVIIRQRADAARSDRDAAIGDLRESLPDEEILASLGIDLGQIEG